MADALDQIFDDPNKKVVTGQDFVNALVARQPDKWKPYATQNGTEKTVQQYFNLHPEAVGQFQGAGKKIDLRNNGAGMSDRQGPPSAIAQVGNKIASGAGEAISQSGIGWNKPLVQSAYEAVGKIVPESERRPQVPSYNEQIKQGVSRPVAWMRAVLGGAKDSEKLTPDMPKSIKGTTMFSKGLAEGGTEFGMQLTSPANITALVAMSYDPALGEAKLGRTAAKTLKGLRTLISAKFSVSGIEGALGDFPGALDAWKKGDYESAGRLVARGLGDLWVTYQGAKEAGAGTLASKAKEIATETSTARPKPKTAEPPEKKAGDVKATEEKTEADRIKKEKEEREAFERKGRENPPLSREEIIDHNRQLLQQRKMDLEKALFQKGIPDKAAVDKAQKAYDEQAAVIEKQTGYLQQNQGKTPARPKPKPEEPAKTAGAAVPAPEPPAPPQPETPPAQPPATPPAETPPPNTPPAVEGTTKSIADQAVDFLNEPGMFGSERGSAGGMFADVYGLIEAVRKGTSKFVGDNLDEFKRLIIQSRTQPLSKEDMDKLNSMVTPLAGQQQQQPPAAPPPAPIAAPPAISRELPPSPATTPPPNTPPGAAGAASTAGGPPTPVKPKVKAGIEKFAKKLPETPKAPKDTSPFPGNNIQEQYENLIAEEKRTGFLSKGKQGFKKQLEGKLRKGQGDRPPILPYSRLVRRDVTGEGRGGARDPQSIEQKEQQKEIRAMVENTAKNISPEFHREYLPLLVKQTESYIPGQPGIGDVPAPEEGSPEALAAQREARNISRGEIARQQAEQALSPNVLGSGLSPGEVQRMLDIEKASVTDTLQQARNVAQQTGKPEVQIRILDPQGNQIDSMQVRPLEDPRFVKDLAGRMENAEPGSSIQMGDQAPRPISQSMIERAREEAEFKEAVETGRVPIPGDKVPAAQAASQIQGAHPRTTAEVTPAVAAPAPPPETREEQSMIPERLTRGGPTGRLTPRGIKRSEPPETREFAAAPSEARSAEQAVTEARSLGAIRGGLEREVGPNAQQRQLPFEGERKAPIDDVRERRLELLRDITKQEQEARQRARTASEKESVERQINRRKEWEAAYDKAAGPQYRELQELVGVAQDQGDMVSAEQFKAQMEQIRNNWPPEQRDLVDALMRRRQTEQRQLLEDSGATPGRPAGHGLKLGTDPRQQELEFNRRKRGAKPPESRKISMIKPPETREELAIAA